ncbi:TetR/AcrR family transcriptional regulator [Prescottella equi]|uniref:TetR/AcrR family transcriptional regulator n=1 Tax=Rhodococcus hoagii TaxID=43767 RepID=UPI000A10191C|nr:TetR-like C-terminal domain-containing protein [Prescottella equi]ORL73425.1 transcriptional regulator [Prescottella equi]
MTTGTRGPGRPRTEGHDERILEATLALIDSDEPVTVNRVLEISGLSRAALYRRWPTMTDLVAAALDHGRSTIDIDASTDVKRTLSTLLFGDIEAARGKHYSDRRFRKRVALVMDNPELQQAYWSSHVRRRRRAMTLALEAAVARGELRADLDVDAAIDAINGIFYYQAVARGAQFDDPETLQRCIAAFEIVWRGMENR